MKLHEFTPTNESFMNDSNGAFFEKRIRNFRSVS